MREVFEELMRILKIILTLILSKILNFLLFLTTKQKELQPFKRTNLLLGTKFILGNYSNS